MNIKNKSFLLPPSFSFTCLSTLLKLLKESMFNNMIPFDIEDLLISPNILQYVLKALSEFLEASNNHELCIKIKNVLERKNQKEIDEVAAVLILAIDDKYVRQAII